MNVQRKITVALAYPELVRALKAAYPASLHVQGLPEVSGTPVSMETAGNNKGLVISYTTNIPDRE